jgi:predicted Zn-dependent protease
MKSRAARLAMLAIFAAAFLTAGVFGQTTGSSVPPQGQQQPAPPQAQPPDISSTTASQTQQQPPSTTDNAPSSMGADPEKVKHGGGKNDVEAIGNRDIGGHGMGNWYSIEKEIAIGKQYAQQVEASVKLIQDPVVNEYVNRIGQNIVRNSDAKVPFTIKVIDSDVVNAMALPGGFFYVNSGLILAADNEAELAGVMAHEIAHVCAHHAMRAQTRGNWMQIASIPLIMVGGGIGIAAQSAASLALPMTFMKFTRGFEAEADYLGLQYMYKKGYDPQSFVSFFEKIQAQEKKKPGFMDKAFGSHPMTPDRVESAQKEIASILPARDQYIVTTSEFDDVKARLAAIENKRKVDDRDDNRRPSLRRQTADSTKPGDSKNGSDEDRPTLHRRDQ